MFTGLYSGIHVLCFLSKECLQGYSGIKGYPVNRSSFRGKIEFRGKLKDSANVQMEMEMLQGNPKEFVPNPPLLARMVNRKREKERPNQPKEDDLDCEVSLAYLNISEEFQVADVKNEGPDGETVARHIMYATSTQLDLLRRAETIFMDGTFKSVKKPFRHSCLRSVWGSCQASSPCHRPYVALYENRLRCYLAGTETKSYSWQFFAARGCFGF